MIYLDNAATTPLLPFTGSEEQIFYANPSSPHSLGIASERMMNDARKSLASVLCYAPSEIVFTSGGTESNNLAILGFALAQAKSSGCMVFAEPWAHPSVLGPIRCITELGLSKSHVAPITSWSIPASGPVLACLSHVSHETGDIADIAAVARKIKGINPVSLIFVDGAQGFCREEMPPPDMTDMYSFSGHKLHAPTGTGGFAVRKGIKLLPLLHGGGQENGLRSGTENLAGLLHMEYVARHLNANRRKNYGHVLRLKESLSALRTEIPGLSVNSLSLTADPYYPTSSPYILNMSFAGTKGEILVHMLAEKGIYVSMGAACRSRKWNKSTLAAMGFPRETAEGALRFSFSHANTPEEVSHVKNALAACVKQLRKINGWNE
jgi:cysteine desulfurase